MRELLAMLTAQLMAGSSPDNIHAVHVPRLMDLAEQILAEAVKRTAKEEPPAQPERPLQQ